MGDLVITGLEDDLVERISQLPASRRETIERDLRAMLRRAVPDANFRRERARRASEIAAMTPKVPQTDSVLLLREDRDR